jgi:DNA-binding MarR family transcriptional regulator
MKDEKKAREYIEKFYHAQPVMFFDKVRGNNKGLIIILRLLFQSEKEVVAGDISKNLKMTTPRVAAALKTLEKKGYIVRTTSPQDARKTIVAITDEGEKALKKQETEVVENFDYLIENVGEKDMDEFLRILNRFQNAIKEKENKSKKDKDV